MSYCYAVEKPFIFTEDGQVMFLKVRDAAQKLVKTAGCVRGDKLMAAAGSGSSWSMMACVDRLVELKELVEVPTHGAWQYKIFIDGRYS